MNKIPTVYVRDSSNPKHVTGDLSPGCEWVRDGEGTPTRKYDGTCVMLDDDSRWWARREVKPGKTPPPNYQPVTTDPNTGKTMGWEPIEHSAFAKFHAEAVGAGGFARSFMPGTYELCGPKINGNPEGFDEHRLICHGAAERVGVSDELPEALIAECRSQGWEGVVWHHPDGRMAKLKVRDMKWGDR